MTDIRGFQTTEITRWARQHVTPGSEVMSDGLAFSPGSLAGCKQNAIVAGGGPRSVTKAEFTWVNTMIGNVKNAITGTCHSVGGNHKHLPRYLAEFFYRFNRRFKHGGHATSTGLRGTKNSADAVSAAKVR